MRMMRHGADGLLESVATSGSERLFWAFPSGGLLGGVLAMGSCVVHHRRALVWSKGFDIDTRGYVGGSLVSLGRMGMGYQAFSEVLALGPLLQQGGVLSGGR